jgi:hypothetical protein
MTLARCWNRPYCARTGALPVRWITENGYHVFLDRQGNGEQHSEKNGERESQVQHASHPGEPTPAQRRAAYAAEEEIRLLRHEVLVGFDSGGHEILRSIGREGKHEVPVAPQDADRVRGTVLTHNHTRGWQYPSSDPRRAGNAPSPTDAVNAARLNLRELRVVTPGYRYSLRPGPRGWPLPEQISSVVAASFARVYQQLQADVDEGKMQPAEASAQTWHIVWLDAAPRLGLIYEREGR